MKGKTGVLGSHFVLNTGAKIPAIGLGTWQSGGDLCVEAVKTALSVGYRHIDCAHLYGNETEVGEALGEAFNVSLKREDVFLTSKLYCTMNSLNKIENYVRVSLKNLGVSYLDLYLMHWPDSSAFGDATDPPSKSGSEYRQFLNRLKHAWKAMEALVDCGLVRAIGVSNFSVQQIKVLLKFAKVVPAVNQVGSSFLLTSTIHSEQIFITGCSFIDLDKSVPPPFPINKDQQLSQNSRFMLFSFHQENHFLGSKDGLEWDFPKPPSPSNAFS